MNDDFITRSGRSVPLYVKALSIFGNTTSILGVMLIIIGTLFIYFVIPEFNYKDIIFMFNESVETSGIIKKINQTHSTENKRRVYAFEYTYTVNGKNYHGISYSTDRNHFERQEVDVVYLKNDASNAHISGMRSYESSMFFFFVILFPLAGIIMLTRSIRKGLRIISTFEHGESALGCLISINPTPMLINRQTVFKIQFEYKDKQGIVHAGSTYSHNISKLVDEEVVNLIYNTKDFDEILLIDSLPWGTYSFVESNFLAKS